MGPVRTVRRVPWATIYSHIKANWKPGQCFTIVGPRGSGKTHLSFALAELTPYVLVLATKRRDPLITDLQRHGYMVTGSLDDVLWTEKDGPVHRRIVYWPQFPSKMPEKQRLAAQAAAMRKALDWADETGKWQIVIDETMFMVESLKVEDEIKRAYYQGRTQGVGLIANGQRPVRMPRLSFSSADYLFLAKTSDRRDVINLREISTTIPSDLIESGLQQLDKQKHEFLFVDGNHDAIAITVAPPR